MSASCRMWVGLFFFFPVACNPPKPKTEVDTVEKLRLIGLAFHNYFDTTNAMPDDIVGKDGKPLLSWRVALLPYLDQSGLHKEFRLDEPWDSPRNALLHDMMPEVYASSRFSVRESGHTVFLGFSGPQAMFGRGQAPADQSLWTVTDGTSNTLLVVETSTPVPWTKPQDISVTPNGTLPNFGSAYGDKPYVLFVDGSVGRLDLKRMPPDTLRTLATRNGGEDPGKWERFRE